MIKEDVILPPSDKEARGTLLSTGALSFSVLNPGLRFPCNKIEWLTTYDKLSTFITTKIKEAHLDNP